MAHKVTVNDKEIIYLDSHKSLLECLEQSNIEVHYHCRDGFCGVCRVKLNKGNINYPNGDPLAYIGEQEILPCCCVPCSDLSLEIE